MKKFIAILILAAAPVVFAQESKASSLKANSKTTEQVDQEKKEAIAAEKQRQVASQKEADAKAAEAKKVQTKSTSTEAKAPKSLRETHSKSNTEGSKNAAK